MSDDIAITYEKLYELLRLEKNKDDLQRLDPAFFEDLISYLKEKERIYNNARNKVDIFSITERDSVQIQLTNIKRIIKELYERREKKIINMAINKSRTQSSLVDMGNMLDEEKLLFKSLVGELDFFRQGVLHSIFLLKAPDVSVKGSTKSEVLAASSVSSDLASEFDESEQLGVDSSAATDIASSQALAAIDSFKAPVSNTKKVKFTQDMPQFVGEELELYGPFEAEEQATLPSNIAELVISNGSAVEVSE